MRRTPGQGLEGHVAQETHTSLKRRGGQARALLFSQNLLCALEAGVQRPPRTQRPAGPGAQQLPPPPSTRQLSSPPPFWLVQSQEAALPPPPSQTLAPSGSGWATPPGSGSPSRHLSLPDLELLPGVGRRTTFTQRTQHRIPMVQSGSGSAAIPWGQGLRKDATARSRLKQVQGVSMQGRLLSLLRIAPHLRCPHPAPGGLPCSCQQLHQALAIPRISKRTQSGPPPAMTRPEHRRSRIG